MIDHGKPIPWRKGYIIDSWDLEAWERALAGEHFIYFLDFAALQVNILLRMHKETKALNCEKVLGYIAKGEKK